MAIASEMPMMIGNERAISAGTSDSLSSISWAGCDSRMSILASSILMRMVGLWLERLVD